MPNQNNCFELYGFDILIDNTLRPWLLEVNLSPSLGTDTQLDIKIKSAMLTDLLTLVGIPAVRSTSDAKKCRFKSMTSGMPTSTSRRSHADMKSTTKRLHLGLSAEENRILKSVRAQDARRGGFVRIFPTPETMHKYGMFLDNSTGVPMSIVNAISMAPILNNQNFNSMLHTQLFNTNAGFEENTNSIVERMKQYERSLVMTKVHQIFKSIPAKNLHQAKNLRKQLQRAMEGGSELTLVQTRKLFSLFLECVLHRLTHDTRNQHGSEQHEKLILKFITRADLTIKPPMFMKNPNSTKIPAKDRTAIVAKLLGDFIESFDRDTGMCVDNYNYYGLIPSQLFEKFAGQASESDLEFILTLHINLTQNLAFLSNRCTPQTNIPVPPIPTGANGFLKALPSMTPNLSTRDLAQIDSYYRSLCPVPSHIDRDISCDNLENITTNRLKNTSLQPIKKRANVA